MKLEYGKRCILCNSVLVEEFNEVKYKRLMCKGSSIEERHTYTLYNNSGDDSLIYLGVEGIRYSSSLYKKIYCQVYNDESDKIIKTYYYRPTDEELIKYMRIASLLM